MTGVDGCWTEIEPLSCPIKFNCDPPTRLTSVGMLKSVPVEIVADAGDVTSSCGEPPRLANRIRLPVMLYGPAIDIDCKISGEATFWFGAKVAGEDGNTKFRFDAELVTAPPDQFNALFIDVGPKLLPPCQVRVVAFDHEAADARTANARTPEAR
jgi:hypothetical protein